MAHPVVIHKAPPAPPSATPQARYFQPPSVCVNAAGITLDNFLLDMEEDDFDKVVQVNLKVGRLSGCAHSPSCVSHQALSLQGSFLVIQAVARALVASGATKGSLITVGSIVGKVRIHLPPFRLVKCPNFPPLPLMPEVVKIKAVCLYFFPMHLFRRWET